MQNPRFVPISISMADTVYYRGITGQYNPNKFPPVIWVTQDREYAKLYAETSAHVHLFRVKKTHSFDFGFRTLQVHVKIGDILDRVRRGIMDSFTSKKVSRERAMELVSRLSDIEDKHSGAMLRAWEWIEKAQDDIVPILKTLKYDSIVAREGTNNNITTYGLFHKEQLVKIE